MTIPFEASRLKIWRANQHVATLESEISAYLSQKPAHVNIRPAIPPKDAGMVFYEVIITHPIPIHLPTIVGDIVHNLRTSLDLLACELVRINGGDDAYVYFPFAKDAASLDAMITRRGMDQAKSQVVDHIRSLAPYPGGNAVLRGIHDLDIMDKHRMLVLTHGRIRVPFSEGEPIIPSSGIQFNRTDRQGVDRTGLLSQGHIRANNWPIGEQQQVVFDLTFPQEVPFAAEPLISLSKDFVKDFSGLIDSFEMLCFGAITKQFPWT